MLLFFNFFQINDELVGPDEVSQKYPGLKFTCSATLAKCNLSWDFEEYETRTSGSQAKSIEIVYTPNLSDKWPKGAIWQRSLMTKIVP
jgi:hypothetical protein